MLQTKTYDFKSKKTGSVVENPAVGYLNGVEFTQYQYDGIYGSSLHVDGSIINMEFVFPINEAKEKIKHINIFFTGKSSTGMIQLVSGDYSVYNRKNEFTQKMLEIGNIEMSGQNVQFTITSITDIDIYGVKVNVTYDDSTMYKYSGKISYVDVQGVIDKIVDNWTMQEIQTFMGTLSENSVEFATFIHVPVEGVTG